MDERRTILIILRPGKVQRRQGSINFVAIGGGDRVEVLKATTDTASYSRGSQETVGEVIEVGRETNRTRNEA